MMCVERSAVKSRGVSQCLEIRHPDQQITYVAPVLSKPSPSDRPHPSSDERLQDKLCCTVCSTVVPNDT